MNAVELIGFFVTIAMIVFYLLKGIRDELDRRRNPEEYARREKEREANLRRLMGDMHPDYSDDDEELEEELRPEPSKALKLELQRRAAARRVAQPVPPKVEKKKQETFENKESTFLKDVKSADSYEVLRKVRVSRGMKLIKQQHSARDLLILKELFDKPLSMR